jgi:hypothetical protein
MNFFHFCLFALLITKVLSTPKYFVGTFNGATQWAFPIGFCTPSAASSSQIVTCDNTGTIAMVSTYSGLTCSGNAKTTTNYTASSVTSTGLYAFNCVGTNDYIATKVVVGSCDTPVITLTSYGVVNVCFGFGTTVYSNITLLTYQKAQCNATNGIVTVYVSGYPAYSSSIGCASSAYLVGSTVSYVQPECTYYYTLGSLVIYAQIEDCVYNDYSQFPQYYDNSADFTASSYTFAENYTISFDISPSETAIANNYPVDLCGENWEQWFTAWFPGCKFFLESQCTTYAADFEDTDLASISVWANVICYTSSSFTYQDCASLNLESQLMNDNVTVSSVTCASYQEPKTTTSAGFSQGINFIILAIGFTMSLYIF